MPCSGTVTAALSLVACGTQAGATEYFKRVEVPLLEAAAWALTTQGPSACAEKPDFDSCRDPWPAAEAWQYAAANVLAATAWGAAVSIRATAVSVARTLGRFFAEPTSDTFASAAKEARLFRQELLQLGGTGSFATFPRQLLTVATDGGLGVPFPISSVQLPQTQATATLQLKSGLPMPLIALAVSAGIRPSIAEITNALRQGVRHLEVHPSAAGAVGAAIAASGIARKELFLSMPWELPLTSDDRFDDRLSELGTSNLDLLQLPRGPDAEAMWRRLERLRRAGRVRVLGVKDFSPPEIDSLPGAGALVEYAQCSFSPYRQGPTRDTWRALGQRSVALATSSLLSDWPHALRPVDDPHVRAVASRLGRSAVQVLIRWVLQLGLAVVLRENAPGLLPESLGAFSFELDDADMQLLSSLATLAEPGHPPGDGFAHVYEPQPLRPARGFAAEL